MTLAKPTSNDGKLMQELSTGLDFLLAQLTDAERERDEARGISNEQQKALVLSMELMRRLETEVGVLRDRVETVMAPDPPVPSPADSEELQELRESNARSTEVTKLANETIASLEERVQLLQKQLADQDAQLEEQQSGVDPEAAMRVLEDQRNQARNDAASARADLAIQTAEIETKDTLIAALEQALDQQHASLRGLEERFAEYASRLQELRGDRLRLANVVGDGDEPTSQKPGRFGILKRAFSRPRREETVSKEPES